MLVLLPGALGIPCHANMHIDTQTRERRKAMKQEPDLAAETILTANELKAQAEELESALHKYDLTEEESKEKVFPPQIIDVKGRAARFFIGLLVNRAGNIDQRGHGQVDQERLPKISLGLRAPWAQSASGHLH